MKRLAILLLIPSLAWGHNTQISGDKNVNIDTRCYAPYLKQSIPDFNLTTGDSYSITLRNHAAQGDDDVVASGLCSDVAPTIVLGGTSPTGCTLNASDPDVATYDCVNVSGTSGTVTFTFDNSVGAAIVESVNWTVAASVSAQLIPVGGREFFVANNGHDTNNGRYAIQGTSCNLPSGCPGAGLDGPWQTLNKVALGPTGGFLAGDDVYLKGGSVFPEQFTWTVPGGVSAVANREYLGAYYCAGGSATNACDSGSSAYVLTPSIYTVRSRPTDFTYTIARPQIQGTYLSSCRLSGDPSAAQQTPTTGPYLKCPWETAASVYVVGAHGNYGPGGLQARPTTNAQALVQLKFQASAKYFTMQDIDIYGSAGEGIHVSSLGSANCINDPTCRIESSFERLWIHNIADQAIDFDAVERAAVHFVLIEDGKLMTGDQQLGYNDTGRGGASIIETKCSPCEILVEGVDIHGNFSESAADYFNSYVIFRGMRVGAHSLSGGSASHIVYEQNILFGTETPVYSPPAVYSLFPFWSLVFENAGNNKSDHLRPVWLAQGQTGYINLGIVRRNNFSASGKTIANMFSAARYATATTGGPFVWTRATGWDFGNTIIVGSQASQAPQWTFRDLQPGCNAAYPATSASPGIGAETSENPNLAGCRPDTENGLPASTLGDWQAQDNLYLVQDGYTPASQTYCLFSKGAGGTYTMGYNGFSTSGASTGTCAGTGNVVGTTFATWGITSHNFIADEWRNGIVSEASFLPSSGGAGNNVGRDLSGSDSSVIDVNDTTWDWMLSQRIWLPACNVSGAQVTKAEWAKKLTWDFCGEARGGGTGWDLGARSNAP